MNDFGVLDCPKGERYGWGNGLDFELLDAGPGNDNQSSVGFDNELVSFHNFLDDFEDGGGGVADLNREGQHEFAAVVEENCHLSVVAHGA